MRRLLKFLHTIGAVGLMGAMACLLVLLVFVPAPASLAQYALIRGAMGGIAKCARRPGRRRDARRIVERRAGLALGAARGRDRERHPRRVAAAAD